MCNRCRQPAGYLAPGAGRLRHADAFRSTGAFRPEAGLAREPFGRVLKMWAELRGRVFVPFPLAETPDRHQLGKRLYFGEFCDDPLGALRFRFPAHRWLSVVRVLPIQRA